MPFETKNIFELKSVQQTGEIEGYGSVFSITDQGGDTVDKGAFSKNIERVRLGGAYPKMLWQHDTSQVIGVWTEMRADDYGLYLKGRLLLELPRAKEAHVLLANKAIDGLSIGYITKEAERDAFGTRRLIEVDLIETSVVTFPMNRESIVTGVKKIQTIREIEQILRDAGLPNNFAKTIASKGFDAAMAEVKGEQRDADSIVKGLSSLQQSLNSLKENLNA